MFYPIRNGTNIVIGDNGEHFSCWLPPLPADKSEIINWGKPKEEQVWKREPIPKWYLERSLEEEYKQADDLKLFLAGKKKTIFVDPMCEKYRRRDFYRRRYGVWVMINGEPTYLTNHHFYYLQWARFDHKENDGYPYYYEFSKTNFYIRQWCEENPWSMGYMMIGPRATGKCLGKGTKVMMYHGGFKNVEDVIEGDQLMGPDSKPRNVLSIASGKDDLFEVVQNRGINYVVNSCHILSLRRNKGRLITNNKNRKTQSPIYPSFGMIANLPVLEFASKSKSFKSVFSGYKVGIEYSERQVTIDPYFLGLWLGDGASQYPRITNVDQEILDWLSCFCAKENLNLVRVGESPINPRVASYTLSSHGVRSSKNHLLDKMRGYSLINNKHIPEDYLYNTREVRLKLLAGLMDTDGSFSRGHYEITQVRKELIDQILILVNGLGFRAAVHPKIVNGVTYYRLGFSGAIDVPVLLDRKKNRGKPNKDVLLTRIDQIKPLGRGEYYGFEIDGDHLFLLEDGTVTHNTNEELACIANRATMLHNHRAALQSKHYENDAKGVLIQAKMVPLFNALPKFQKPEYAHGTNTQSELVFRRRSITGKQTLGLEFTPDIELISTIFAAPPGEKALDTETLSDLFEDEIGKTNPKEVADIYVRHEVNLKCVFRNNRKVGILRKTSTVEEMTDGGDECFKLWKDSDPKIVDGNGFTTSKIHRHLISALDTDTSLVDYIDAKGKNYGPPCNKYGQVNREIANIKIQNDFDAVKHDLKKLSGRMRKSPRNQSEAFIKDQSKSIFNIMLITNRLEHIRNGMAQKPYVKGNLYWLKERFGPVWWERDDHAGRFNFAWFPDEFKRGHEQNQMPGETGRILNNVWKEWGYNMKGEAQELITPGNMKQFRIATDPIKYTKTKDPRASKAAIHAFRMYDHLVDGAKRSRKDWETHNFFVEYCNRPDDPAQYVEDLAMLCIFLGTKVLPERNIPYVNEFFEQKGLQRLLFYNSEAVEGIGLDVQTTSEDAGFATTPEVTNYLTTRLIPYINQDIDRCPFDDTIEDWGNFDPLNPTKSHLTFSSGLALVHSEKVIREDAPIESKINDWFDSFDNDGFNGKFTPDND